MVIFEGCYVPCIGLKATFFAIVNYHSCIGVCQGSCSIVVGAEITVQEMYSLCKYDMLHTCITALQHTSKLAQATAEVASYPGSLGAGQRNRKESLVPTDPEHACIIP